MIDHRAARIDDALFRFAPYTIRSRARRLLRPELARKRAMLRDKLRPSLEQGALFIHIPKTGGQSVKAALFGEGFAAHRTYRDYQMLLTRREFDRLFTFAFVRNPWDRLASAFAYLKRGGSNERDRAWAAEHLAGFETLDDFVHRWLSPENVWKGVHFRPQTHFLQGRPGRIAVDFVGRFERIGDDYEVLRQRLGFGEPLPHLNRTPGAHHYDGLYTPESAAIVRNIYAEDVRLFGYEDAAPTTG